MYEISDIVWLGPVVLVTPVFMLFLIYKIFNGGGVKYGERS